MGAVLNGRGAILTAVLSSVFFSLPFLAQAEAGLEEAKSESGLRFGESSGKGSAPEASAVEAGASQGKRSTLGLLSASQGNGLKTSAVPAPAERSEERPSKGLLSTIKSGARAAKEWLGDHAIGLTLLGSTAAGGVVGAHIGGPMGAAAGAGVGFLAGMGILAIAGIVYIIKHPLIP